MPKFKSKLDKLIKCTIILLVSIFFTLIMFPISAKAVDAANQMIPELQQVYNDKVLSITISINISVMQLLQDDFVDSVLRILEKVDLSPQFLELEITESIFLNSTLNNIIS